MIRKNLKTARKGGNAKQGFMKETDGKVLTEKKKVCEGWKNYFEGLP